MPDHRAPVIAARAAAALGALALAATGAALAQAQPWPTKPVRLIVPFSPGGAADVPARIVAQRIAEGLGQAFVIDNRPGAGSTIGAEAVAKATADGYTLLAVSNTHFVGSALHRKLAFDPVADFAPVSQFVSAPNMVVVHPSLPVKSIRELIALARAKPGQLNYASSGNGSTQHLTGALFAAMAGIDMLHVPYRGSGPAVADLVGGQIMVGFPGVAGMIPFIKAGKLRPLAVTGTRRSPELPDVPTVAESGLKGYDITGWVGLAGPRALPREVALRLHGELLRVLKVPEAQKQLAGAGQEVAFQDTPEQFGEFLKAEASKWARIVQVSGATIQ